MVPVEPGGFFMGCNADDEKCQEDQKPGGKVVLDAFEIDRTEVTQKAYAKCVEAGVCKKPLKNWDPENKANYPVVSVSWHDADIYCREFVNKRLPTEAEWEKAARGTDGRTYPWGEADPTCHYAQYYACPLPRPVGETTAGKSPYGALDMAGDVWEWVSDYYGEDYYKHRPEVNPAGPSSGMYRAMRGGSLSSHWTNLRSSVRKGQSPDYHDEVVGFRCARSVD